MQQLPVIKPELTVAAVIEKDGHFLLVEERIDGRAVYNQPAGHVEAGESIIEAMVRETCEETGWQVEAEALLGLYYWPQTRRGDCILRCAFSARLKTRVADKPLDNDIIGTHWLSRDALAARPEQLRSPLVLAAIDAWLSDPHLPLSTLHHLSHD